MWGRFKGQVLRSREDQDASDDDTIISRALLRYYTPHIPSWLSANTDDNLIAMQLQQYQLGPSESGTSSPSYSRRGSSAETPRMFERSGSFALPSTSGPQAKSKPSNASSSGLASRLKNSNW